MMLAKLEVHHCDVIFVFFMVRVTTRIGQGILASSHSFSLYISLDTDHSLLGV